MKRRISDLLDTYLDDTVEMKGTSPLSSERIKELTLNKIEAKSVPARRRRQIVSKIAAIAAAISVLTVTAAAAEEIWGVSDWFRGILKRGIKEDVEIVQQESLNYTVRETITENQLQKLDDLGQVKNEAVTSNGATITLTALYSDEYAMHLYFQVEAPAGTVLPDDICYTFTPNGIGYPLELDGGCHVINLSAKTDALPDNDPTDNKKDFHLTLLSPSFGITPSSDVSYFNDSISKKIHLRGLYEQTVNGGEDTFQCLIPGDFAFDITNPVRVERTEINVENTAYGGHVIPDNGEGAEYDYLVTPTYMAIGPLSVEWKCESTCTDIQRSYGMSLRIVLKDGTSPRNYETGGGTTEGVYLFSAPVDLEEVDYILIGDENLNSTHKVYLTP